MLEEALGVIRLLWQGGNKNHRGQHYVVEDAQIFDLPDQPPPILVAAAGKRTTRIAAELGDGLLSVAPDPDLVNRFDQAGGADKPKYAKITACWAPDVDQARRVAHEVWPVAGLPGRLMAELRVTEDFEAATSVLDEAQVAAGLVVGPDPQLHPVRRRPVRQGRVRPRRGPPGGARPGGLLRLLPARSPAPLPVVDRQGGDDAHDHRT